MPMESACTEMIANTSKLRLIAIRRTTSGNQADHRTLDLPIIGWEDRDGRPWPVVVAALDPTDVLRLFDPDAKCWFSMSGEMFRTYAEASAEAWRGPQQPEASLAAPVIGGMAADHYGIGQEPARHRSVSGPRAAAPAHPRERIDDL